MNKALIVILSTVALDAIGAGLIFPILPDLLREVTGGDDFGFLYGAHAVCICDHAIRLLTRSRRAQRSVRAASRFAALSCGHTHRLPCYGTFAARLGACGGKSGCGNNQRQYGRRERLHHRYHASRSACAAVWHNRRGDEHGFIIGPVIGGVMGAWWLRAPFLAAALFNGLNLLVALFALPESRSTSQDSSS